MKIVTLLFLWELDLNVVSGAHVLHVAASLAHDCPVELLRDHTVDGDH